MPTKVGTFVYIKLGAGEKPVIGESSTSFKSAQTMIDISSKASGQNSEFAAGRITRTISVASIASTDPTLTDYSFQTALAAQVTATPIAFYMTGFSVSGNKVSGDTIISGTALISNVAWEVPDNDKLTFSLDLQVTGTVTVDVNATVNAPTGTTPQAKSIGQTIANLTATGTAIKWYKSSNGGSVLLTSEVLEARIYYATQTVGGVESSARLAVTVTLS